MLHESIAQTRKEATVTENEGFRLRLVKHEVISPKGLFNVDFIQESLKEDGTVGSSSTYNFHMTKEELQRLAYTLTA